MKENIKNGYGDKKELTEEKITKEDKLIPLFCRGCNKVIGFIPNKYIGIEASYKLLCKGCKK